jgi:hypothetical protein
MYDTQGRIQDFELGGGAHLKKLRRAEGGAKILGVFRVKIHDFTPKKQITESPSYPDLKNVTLLDYGGAVTWRHLVLDSEGQPGIRPPTKR